MFLTLTAAAFGMLTLAAPHSGSTPMTVPQLQHMAPVLVVDRLEPCLKFWVDRFGFTVENQVPGPDGPRSPAPRRSSRATRRSTDRPRSTSANLGAIRWGLLRLRKIG